MVKITEMNRKTDIRVSPELLMLQLLLILIKVLIIDLKTNNVLSTNVFMIT